MPPVVRNHNVFAVFRAKFLEAAMDSCRTSIGYFAEFCVGSLALLDTRAHVAFGNCSQSPPKFLCRPRTERSLACIPRVLGS